MSDDTSPRSAQDCTGVDTDQEYEVRYWTERFGVSREDLQRAVDQVSNSVAAVAPRLRGEPDILTAGPLLGNDGFATVSTREDHARQG